MISGEQRIWEARLVAGAFYRRSPLFALFMRAFGDSTVRPALGEDTIRMTLATSDYKPPT